MKLMNERHVVVASTVFSTLAAALCILIIGLFNEYLTTRNAQLTQVVQQCKVGNDRGVTVESLGYDIPFMWGIVYLHMSGYDIIFVVI